MKSIENVTKLRLDYCHKCELLDGIHDLRSKMKLMIMNKYKTDLGENLSQDECILQKVSRYFMTHFRNASFLQLKFEIIKFISLLKVYIQIEV